MDAQKFLQDRIGTLAMMLTPGPGAAKVLTQIQGDTPQSQDSSSHKGPLFKLGGDGFKMRDDSQIYHDPEMGYYGPGRL